MVVVSRGVLHRPARLPGFIAEVDRIRKGLLTYKILHHDCEIVTLNSLLEGQGIGSALINAVRQEAQKAQCHRLWLITTNDNHQAIRFYEKQGFQLAAVHRDAVKESRKLKPEIPLIGKNGIPIQDEIEMDVCLPKNPE